MNLLYIETSADQYNIVSNLYSACRSSELKLIIISNINVTDKYKDCCDELILLKPCKNFKYFAKVFA